MCRIFPVSSLRIVNLVDKNALTVLKMNVRSTSATKNRMLLLDRLNDEGQAIISREPIEVFPDIHCVVRNHLRRVLHNLSFRYIPFTVHMNRYSEVTPGALEHRAVGTSVLERFLIHDGQFHYASFFDAFHSLRLSAHVLLSPSLIAAI